MITYLRIKNIAVIEEAELELEPGFVVLTGETGAGKSIIVGGVKFLLSGKGDPDIIRSGEENAKIEVMFEGDTTASVEIRKTRSKGILNGELVPLKKLSEAVADKIDIFGQRDHYFLLDSSNHLLFLDSFLGLLDLRKRLANLWENIKEKEAALKRIRAEKEERERERDFLQFQINEIERANLRPGEEEELREKREFILKRERLKELFTLVSAELEEEGGAKDRLWSMKSALEELSDSFADMKAYFQEIDSFLSVLSDLNFAISEKSSVLEETEGNIEEIEERLALIERLKKKYGETIDDILEYRNRAKKQLQELEQEDIEEKLEKELEALFEEYRKLAGELSFKRKKGASILKKEAEEKLKKLVISRPIFEVILKKTEPYEFGLEEGEFFFSANPGEEPKPLRKIASGGELSRVMLALKSLNAEEGKTFIFDEIDTGIGGRTAYTLGKMLKDLSQRSQIIVVTHLPQVAAFADQHFVIEKEVKGGRTYTYVREVSGEERLKELARMLAGDTSESALKTARELLDRTST